MFLEEIKLCTKNIPALYDFYNSVLELPVKYIGEKAISVEAGHSRLLFENVDSVREPFYHFAFNIPSNKFEEAFQWLQNKAALLWLEDYNSYIADFVNWHAKSVYFSDPSGNILELIARFELKDYADELFSSKQFRNISEIGLVFPEENFEANVEALMDQYPLQYFSKQPPLPHFRAVGNDDGLFIIVPENRNWFATKKPSGIFPTEFSFVNDNELYRLRV